MSVAAVPTNVTLCLTLLQREAEHRENLATTIRTLRASESEQTMEIVCEGAADMPGASALMFGYRGDSRRRLPN